MLDTPYLGLDPGNTVKAINVDRQNVHIPLVSTGASETRTLAAPAKPGVIVTLVHDTDGRRQGDLHRGIV